MNVSERKVSSVDIGKYSSPLSVMLPGYFSYYFIMIISQYIHIICSNVFMWQLVVYSVFFLVGLLFLFVAFQQSSRNYVFFNIIFVVIESDPCIIGS